jgi:hypothetical protein
MVTWTWFKEKTAEALVNSLMAGLLLLVGWAILQAFLGDYRAEKSKDELKREMVEKHNDAVVREADLLKKIETLSLLIGELRLEIGRIKPPSMPGSIEPPPGPPGMPPGPPGTPPGQQAQQPPNPHQFPSDARMDWIERYRQRIAPNQVR